MNQPSRQLLIKLLHMWQNNPERSRQVRLPMTRQRALPYFEAVLPDDKQALHAGLEEAEAAGTILLEWGKGYESHILRRITLKNGTALARYLGLPVAAQQADSARPVLEEYISGRERWIGEWVEALLDRWRHNQPVNGIEPGDIETAALLVRALEGVAAGRQRNLDLRTFSTRELGASKAMESILPKFAAVWRKYRSADYPAELTNLELFESLGLLKFPQPLLLRGPLMVRLASRQLDCEGIEPYLGLPPQAIVEVLADKHPAYCLTIENLASFNRYSTEIHDRGLIIFTSGFPSPGLADFLKMLDKVLPVATPLFHWGDIDEGGLKILAYIAQLVERKVQPHLMTAELLAKKGQFSPLLRREEVTRLGAKGGTVGVLADAILSTDPPKTLEQENVDPCPPVSLG